LYDSRGEVSNEAFWWSLEQALNAYRDATIAQQVATTAQQVATTARQMAKAQASVDYNANVVKRSREDKKNADKEESERAGRIPAVTIVAIVLAVAWFAHYIYSHLSGPGPKDASSLLQALVLGASICTAFLSLLVIILNGWKLLQPSEIVKRFIDYALFAVSWASLTFSGMVILFNVLL
jgi:hypothetical protein